MNKLIRDLNKYWDVQSQPKQDLRPVRDEFVDLKVANLFYITVTIFVLVIAVMFVCAGVFL